VHVNVYENAFTLAGDLPHAEFESRDSDEHEVVLFREGYFMDRRPGSIHGNDFIFSDTGTTILMWRSGSGNWLHEPNAAEETIEVPFGDGFAPKSWNDMLPSRLGDGVVIDREGAYIVNTRDMAWAPLGDVEGAKVRELVRDDSGRATVRMVFVPPGEAAVEPLPLDEGDWEFAYLVEGELPVAGGEVARQGWFMRRAPGSPDGLVPAAPSITGAVLLQWRMGERTFPSA
jgi:hypothetical protein